MTVVYIRAFVQARANVVRTQPNTAPIAVADRRILANAEQGGAWYHQAAIIEAEKVVPRPD